ncbi:class I SAM-dependent methyltransferase, partial [Patescibacteria group bacterium]|nr:class I SAM-dependent methyltransferase [Patescibacteria group bacterium]
MNREYAQYLLKQTCQDYNLIAGDFSRTRAEMWEGFEFLKDCVAQGERVLDLGCGNGRLYKLLEKQNIDYYGVDCAEKLIDIAKFLYPEAKFQVADALSLPFPDDFFDKVFSIAVLHHIPSRELRAQFLKEAKRVLRKDGLLVITVWDLNPFKMILTKKWKRLLSFLKYTSLKMFTISKLDFKDFFV